MVDPVWTTANKFLVASLGKKLGIFQYILEENIGGRLGSAWELGEFIKKEDLLEGGKLKKVHEGDYIQSFRWKRSI